MNLRKNQGKIKGGLFENIHFLVFSKKFRNLKKKIIIHLNIQKAKFSRKKNVGEN